jgi:hypothetical protein
MAIRVEGSSSGECDSRWNRIAAFSAKCKGNKAGWNFYQGQVWYSRHLGQDVDGNKRYVRLITFRVLSDAEPIAAKAKKAIQT